MSSEQKHTDEIVDSLEESLGIRYRTACYPLDDQQWETRDTLEKNAYGEWTVMHRDGLGYFAAARNLVTQYIKNDEHDRAWKVAHQGLLFPYPADQIRVGFGMHEFLAIICRKENRHLDALTHLIAWLVPIQGLRDFDGNLLPRPKKHDQAINAYTGRCKFPATKPSDVDEYIKTLPFPFDTREIQRQVAQWAASTEE